MTILDCAGARWQPGIGDPTAAAGWITVAVYALAALLALRLALRAPFPPARRSREQAFWLLAGLAMAALAVNKQLDLQSLMTALGRCAARAQGWYEHRRPVQVAAILALAAPALAGLVLLLLVLRGTWARTALPLLGLAFVCGFVLVRAVGFHDVDALLGTRMLGLRANWLVELPGPVLVALSALALSRRPRRASTIRSG